MAHPVPVSRASGPMANGPTCAAKARASHRRAVPAQEDQVAPSAALVDPMVPVVANADLPVARAPVFPVARAGQVVVVVTDLARQWIGST